MKFCPVCERVMLRDLSSGTVEYVCICSRREAGDAYDVRVMSSAGGAASAVGGVEKHMTLIRNAPFDPTVQLVERPCSGCGLPYMAQITVGANLTTIRSCTCGHWEGHSA
jgi:hypothetical protein